MESREIYEEFLTELRDLTGKSLEDDRLKALIADITKCSPGTLTDEWSLKLREKVINELLKIKIAFIVVDFQNDFISGTLSVKEGDANDDPNDAIDPINELLSNEKLDLVVYTLDWHPENHISFHPNRNDPDRRLSKEYSNKELRVFDCVHFEEPNCSQVLYPSHCIEGTWGAELSSKIDIVDGSHMVRKGTDVHIDSYSAFFDNAKLGKTPLEELLKSSDITAVLACGLAYDICVAATLKDSAELGFLSAIVTDCSKGLRKDGISRANEDFERMSIAKINSSEAQAVIAGKFIPFEWIQVLFNRLKTKENGLINGH